MHARELGQGYGNTLQQLHGYTKYNAYDHASKLITIHDMNNRAENF